MKLARLLALAIFVVGLLLLYTAHSLNPRVFAFPPGIIFGKIAALSMISYLLISAIDIMLFAIIGPKKNFAQAVYISTIFLIVFFVSIACYAKFGNITAVIPPHERSSASILLLVTLLWSCANCNIVISYFHQR